MAVFSPIGDVIATASRDGRIGLWDTAGRSLAMLRGHGAHQWARHIAFSPVTDGDVRLASCGTDGTIRVWRPYDYRPVASLNQRSRAPTALAVATPPQISGDRPVTKIVALNKATLVALTRPDSGGWLYRRKDGQQWEAEALPDRIADIAVGSGGIYVVPSGETPCVGTVSPIRGAHTVQAAFLSRSPEGTVFAINKSGVYAVDTPSSAPGLTLEDSSGNWEIRYAAFAANSFAVHLIERAADVIVCETIVSLMHTHATDCDQKFTITAKRNQTKVTISARCSCHTEELKEIVGKQNQDLHSHMKLNGIPVNATTGAEIDTLKRIDISACGRYFVSAGLDNQARLYFTGTRDTIPLLAQNAGTVAHAELVDLGEDGEVGVLTTGGDGSVRIWVVNLEKNASPLPLGSRCDHLAAVTYVTTIEDDNGRQFVSGSADGHVCFWNTSVFDRPSEIVREVTRLYPGGARSRREPCPNG